MSQASSTSLAFDSTSKLSAQIPEAGTKAKHNDSLLTALVIAGVLLRVAVAILAGNGMRTPWGGGGDTPAYVLLAQNILSGKGYAYAGMPTAMRAPGYPLMLAALFRLFRSHALEAMRWLQFFEGIAVALLCAAAAKKLFGEEAAKWTLSIVLFFPTLVQMNGEVLSEAPATVFTALFVYLLVSYWKEPRVRWLVWLGCAIGMGALVRFNLAALGLIALVAVFRCASGSKRWTGATIVFVVSVLMVSPWMIRNFLAFHGQVLFSTEGGPDALHGVLTPQGRALPGDSEMLRAAVGWVPPVDVETNDASRLNLGPEPALDKQCWRAAMAIAEYKGWGLIPLALHKISDFWHSTDQLFWTASFPLWGRVLRAAGVLVYWALLGLAVFGWLRLRSSNETMAKIFLLYALLVTAMHLPFVMSTRLRMPFMDPILGVLAGAMAPVVYGNLRRNRPVLRTTAAV